MKKYFGIYGLITLILAELVPFIYTKLGIKSELELNQKPGVYEISIWFLLIIMFVFLILSFVYWQETTKLSRTITVIALFLYVISLMIY